MSALGRPSYVARKARRAQLALATLAELVRVVIASGRWFLVPMVVVLAFAGVLLVVVQVLEYVAPFVYTVF
ncbi:MAG: DUF5989 family protein [Myxococcota bacterium]|nr:DUF5989 family protein [Myxococcota bacterium]